LTDTVPENAIHSGLFAVEQLYGFLVRNQKTYGILTIYKGLVFLKREPGGRLLVTRMFAANRRQTLDANGYRYFENPHLKIIHALYYLSWIADGTPDVREIDGLDWEESLTPNLKAYLNPLRELESRKSARSQSLARETWSRCRKSRHQGLGLL
jgi:hypothetical protein